MCYICVLISWRIFWASRGDSRRHTLYFRYASNHDIPWISTDDIGDEAAKYLLDDDWAGQWTRNLMGPENLTLLETTAILSQVLDLPLEYVQVTIESIQQRLGRW